MSAREQCTVYRVDREWWTRAARQPSPFSAGPRVRHVVSFPGRMPQQQLLPFKGLRKSARAVALRRSGVSPTQRLTCDK